MQISRMPVHLSKVSKIRFYMKYVPSRLHIYSNLKYRIQIYTEPTEASSIPGGDVQFDKCEININGNIRLFSLNNLTQLLLIFLMHYTNIIYSEDINSPPYLIFEQYRKCFSNVYPTIRSIFTTYLLFKVKMKLIHLI